jgi:hypothetical protein
MTRTPSQVFNLANASSVAHIMTQKSFPSSPQSPATVPPSALRADATPARQSPNPGNPPHPTPSSRPTNRCRPPGIPPRTLYARLPSSPSRGTPRHTRVNRISQIENPLRRSFVIYPRFHFGGSGWPTGRTSLVAIWMRFWIRLPFTFGNPEVFSVINGVQSSPFARSATLPVCSIS